MLEADAHEVRGIREGMGDSDRPEFAANELPGSLHPPRAAASTSERSPTILD